MYEFQGQPQRCPSDAPTHINACDYQQPAGETYPLQYNTPQSHISLLNVGNQAVPQLPQCDDFFSPAPQFGMGNMQQGDHSGVLAVGYCTGMGNPHGSQHLSPDCANSCQCDGNWSVSPILTCIWLLLIFSSLCTFCTCLPMPALVCTHSHMPLIASHYFHVCAHSALICPWLRSFALVPVHIFAFSRVLLVASHLLQPLLLLFWCLQVPFAHVQAMSAFTDVCWACALSTDGCWDWVEVVHACTPMGIPFMGMYPLLPVPVPVTYPYPWRLNDTPALHSSSPQHSPAPQDMHQPSPSPYPYFGAHRPPPQSMRAGSMPQNISSTPSSRGETPYHTGSGHHPFTGGSGSEVSLWAPSVVPGSDKYQAMMLYSMAQQPAHLLHMNQNMYWQNGAALPTDLHDQSTNLNTMVVHLVTEHTDKLLSTTNEHIQKLEDINESSSKTKIQRQLKNVSNDHPALKVMPLKNGWAYEEIDTKQIWHPNWMGNVDDEVNGQFIKEIINFIVDNEKRLHNGPIPKSDIPDADFNTGIITECMKGYFRNIHQQVFSQKDPTKQPNTLRANFLKIPWNGETKLVLGSQQIWLLGMNGVVWVSMKQTDTIPCNVLDKDEDSTLNGDSASAATTKVNPTEGEANSKRPWKCHRTTAGQPKKPMKRVFNLDPTQMNSDEPKLGKKMKPFRNMVSDWWMIDHPDMQVLDGVPWLKGFYTRLNEDDVLKEDWDYLMELDEWHRKQRNGGLGETNRNIQVAGLLTQV
ncbi:uncharacterized protein EDB91DRAFT_1079679 [Suillus paluster]|uniref:uncharacterized protein n=1 Tax=Suillus paluster TaxID=48578 RepID=UPI001B87C1E2|nr:uncharacterized protein EDB91DRAFT_1079679 [Suillus paluster]KAG1747041.1 hypothetical protein EDB91DRAFT_1079679 [Suillus paluster]